MRLLIVCPGHCPLEDLLGRDIAPRPREDTNTFITMFRRTGVGQDCARDDPEPWLDGVSKNRCTAIALTRNIAARDRWESLQQAAHHAVERGALLVWPSPGLSNRIVRRLTESLATQAQVRVLPASVCWPRLAAYAGHALVTAGLPGLEALLAGAKVTCAGPTSISGYGLTRDLDAGPPRTIRTDLTDLAHTVYSEAALYHHPLFDRPMSAMDALTLGAERRRHRTLMSRRPILAGVKGRQRANLATYLRASHLPRPVDTNLANGIRKAAQKKRPLLVWAARCPDDLPTRARADGIDVIRAEDGFLRSVGLGRHGLRPASLVFDTRGIHFDARQVSDLEHLLQTAEIDTVTRSRADRLIQTLRRLGLSKYNCGKAGERRSRPRLDQHYLLVPGQVESDAALRLGSPRIRRNLELLAEVRRYNPHAYIAFKPHPDIEIGHRHRALDPDQVLAYADEILENCDPIDALMAADEVHTMTSLMGFEALIRERTVHTYGQPFYAGWGLTIDHEPLVRRTRPRDLSDLVAAALILYPFYRDPLTGLPCTVEDIVERLNTARQQPQPIGARGRRLMLEAWWRLRPSPP